MVSTLAHVASTKTTRYVVFLQLWVAIRGLFLDFGFHKRLKGLAGIGPKLDVWGSVYNV